MTISRRDFLHRAVVAGAGLSVLELAADACARASVGAGGMSPAIARRSGQDYWLANDTVAITFTAANGSLRATRFDERLTGTFLPLSPDLFTLVLGDGTELRSRDMRLVEPPKLESLSADAGASRFAERLGGRHIVAALEDPNGRVRARWRAELRDGSHYVRQEVSLVAATEPVHVAEIVLVDLLLDGAQVVGSVAGSPIVSGTVFVGFEHPLSKAAADGHRARAHLSRELPLRPGASVAYSWVIGVVRSGQLRRDFLAYVERERAHPYRPFLHYNSWYDLGYFSKYDEAGALAVIDAFGRELHQKRRVVLDSFLFDDGWDDPKTLWSFNSGFPRGFAPLTREAARYGASPGVWLSPWGGYGKPRQDRLADGREQGFETNAGGFMLSGPKYYARFRDTCLRFIREYHVNQFKIDGTGNVSRAFPGSRFDSDFDAAINLIGELRAARPDLYVNLTTGTYPSPFWLRYADSTWRGGEDHSFTGVGSWRQKWITYRDADTYAGVVKKGPLYPLNSLMLHGIIYARSAKNLNSDPQNDFRDEVRAYFGTGTQLQEMYVTPSLLTAANWDALAEAAHWARANADVLVDTHWVGGDPEQLEVYGHAAWTRDRATLCLRNPADKPQSISIDIAQAFELPDDAPQRYVAVTAWAHDPRAPIELRAGVLKAIDLEPFEVVTLDATP